MSTPSASRTPRLWALPAKQARSRETRDRLLLAGRQLLDQGVFEQTPIAGLAAMAGCSVGSFYARFPDKDAFFRAVMDAAEEEILQRVRARVDADSVSTLSAVRTVESCVDLLIDMMLAYRGLICTVQHKSMRDKPAIRPLQRIGLRVIDHFSGLIEAKYGEQGNAVFARNVAVGFQIAFSILMLGLLNAPPVLNEHSPDYRFWIREVVVHALGVRGAPVANHAQAGSAGLAIAARGAGRSAASAGTVRRIAGRAMAARSA